MKVRFLDKKTVSRSMAFGEYLRGADEEIGSLIITTVAVSHLILLSVSFLFVQQKFILKIV